MKGLNCIVVFLFFLFIFFNFSLYYLIKSNYGKKAIKLFENCPNILYGATFMMFKNCFKLTFRGMIHLICKNNPDLQLLFLSLIEFIMIIFAIKLVKSRKNKYVRRLLIWTIIIPSLIQIFLIFMFFIGQC
jgi:hypothetical protein